MRQDNRNSRTTLRAGALALAALTACSVIPKTAHAEEVQPDAKGIVGCALLGAEAVVFVEAIAGVRNSTAYLVGAGLGAAAGGVGGYFIEQSVDNGAVPAYLLAGGLALVIPAIVVALDQTRFLPTEGAREDKPSNLPPSDPGKPGGSAVVGAEAPAATPPATPAPGATPPGGGGSPPAPTPAPGGAGGGGKPKPGPQSLLDIRGGDLRMGLPVPSVRPVFSTTERKKLGVESNGNEVRFPVVNVTF